MVAITILCFFITIGIGNYNTTVSDAFWVFWDKVLGNEVAVDDEHYIWNMYVPRAIGAVIIGGGLAIGGVIMQNLLRNPLAEPYTMGVSSGAMFGVSLSIALRFSIIPGATGATATMVNAFVFSLIPVAIIVLVAMFKKVSPLLMILTGIAVMYLFSTLNQFIMATTEAETMQEIYIWGMGSAARISWDDLTIIAPTVLIISIAIYALSGRLDVMYSGDRNAQSLGLRAGSFRIVALVLVCLLTAAVVCCAGTIGFVGLVAPHVARIFVGSNNRYLIPASAAFAMAFLICADTVVKLIGAGNLPVGVISSLVGGPLFIVILLRMRRHAWM